MANKFDLIWFDLIYTHALIFHTAEKRPVKSMVVGRTRKINADILPTPPLNFTGGE